MKISDNGIRVLRGLEGCSNVPFQDVGGNWTIGVGHYLTRDEVLSGKISLFDGHNYETIDFRKPLTNEQIEKILICDLKPIEVSFTFLLPDLLQCQYDALVCFAFNVGITAFYQSTLLKKIQNKQLDEVPTQMRRWVYCAGQVIEGLKNRREKEIALWNGEI